MIWNKWTDQGYQPIPSLFTVEQNRLVLNRATPEAAGTYQVVVRNSNGEDRQELRINVEPRRVRQRPQPAAGAPAVRFERQQYEVGPGEVVDITPNISVGLISLSNERLQRTIDSRERVERRSIGPKMDQPLCLRVSLHVLMAHSVSKVALAKWTDNTTWKSSMPTDACHHPCTFAGKISVKSRRFSSYEIDAVLL